MDQQRTSRITGIIGALLAWTAVILQFILILQNRTHSVPETIIQFFSYYTILTNILVACCFTAIAKKRVPSERSFLTDPGVLAATLVYIVIVGSIYNLILRALWAPTGLQLLVDELLHTIIPLFYVVFWLTVAPKSRLRWNDVFQWLFYPLGYFTVILFRGTVSGFYPYPFINVTELGWSKVITNSIFITGAFILLSLLVILLSRVISRGRRTDLDRP